MAGDADLARELLGLANDDLAAARAIVDIPSVTDAIVGFHAQQASEKALRPLSHGPIRTSRSPITSRR